MAWLGGRKGGRRVSVPQLMSLIASSETASRWARDDEEHQLIPFWDPDLMVETLEQLCTATTPGGRGERYQNGIGLRIQKHGQDASHCV